MVNQKGISVSIIIVIGLVSFMVLKLYLFKNVIYFRNSNVLGKCLCLISLVISYS